MDLIALLQRGEGKTLEYKRDLSTPDGLLSTLAAFANTSGGVLVVGVEDGTRRVMGIPDVLAVEERLSNMVVDSILPRLVPDIEIVPWRKTHVLVVQVYPSARPPPLPRSPRTGGGRFRPGGLDDSACRRCTDRGDEAVWAGRVVR